jgi:CHAD domain-containing protein
LVKEFVTLRELEAKLSVDDDFEVPDLSECGPGFEVMTPVQRTIVDIYHDTADVRLLRWGCTLRHRRRKGWTVKLPVSTDMDSLTRSEIELGGRARRPPAQARGLVASFARGEPLVAVATITTSRTARSVRTVEGEPVAELADDEVVGETADGLTVTFRQIEVELVPDADPGLLVPIIARLTEAGARPQPAGIKLALVLGTGDLVPDVVVPDLPEVPSASDVVHRAIARSVEQLIVELPRARLGQDPAGIHQARVATRRLRSDLRTFKPLLDPTWASQLHPRLRAVADHLGQVRDADVLHQLLTSTLAERPELDAAAGEEILTLVASQRADALVALGVFLDRAETSDLLDELVDAAASPPVTVEADQPAKHRLRGLVSKRWHRLDQAVAVLDADPPASQLHQVRILAKRVRYATDAVAPAFGRNTRRFSKSLGALQDELGDLNDATVASRWLTSNAGALGPVAAFTAGRLTERFEATPGGDWSTIWARTQTRQPGWLE